MGVHSGNYFKIDYSSLGVTLKGNLNPCSDLEGRPAKVEYVRLSQQGSGVRWLRSRFTSEQSFVR